MTRRDVIKRERVRALLRQEQWAHARCSEVAREARVSDMLVASVRREMGLASSPYRDGLERLDVALRDPVWRAATTEELAKHVGLSWHTVQVHRTARGALPVRKPRPIHGMPKEHAQLIAQVFETALRGGDVQGIIRSELGRQVHQAVVLTRSAR